MHDLDDLKDALIQKQREIFNTEDPPVTPDSVTLQPTDTDFVSPLQELLTDQSQTPVILSGPKGTGKTTAAYQALSSVTDKDITVRIPTSRPSRKYTGTGTEIVYLSYLTGSIESVTNRQLFHWVAEAADSDSRQLVIECRPEQRQQVNDILETNAQRAIEEVPEISFAEAATQTIIENLARQAVPGTANAKHAGADIVTNSVDIAGCNPARAVLVAHRLTDTTLSVNRDHTVQSLVTKYLADDPINQFADNRSLDLLETIAIIDGLPINCATTVLNAEEDELLRVAETLAPFLPDDTNDRLELRSSAFSEAVVRRMLNDPSRRDRRSAQLSTEPCVRHRSDQVARKIVQIHDAAQVEGASEVQTQAITFLNAYLETACDDDPSGTAWLAIANAVDICCRNGLPVKLSIFTDHSEDLIGGYDRLSDEKTFRYVEHPTKRVAANNVGRSVAAHIAESKTDNDVTMNEAIDAIISAGNHFEIDPHLIEYYKNLFAEVLRTLTTRYPETLYEEDTQRTIIDNIGESLCRDLAETHVDPESTALASKTGTDAALIDTLRRHFWTAAMAKILFAHRHNSDERDHWLEFAASWTVHTAADLDTDNPRPFLQDLHEQLMEECDKMANTTEEKQEFTKAVEHALKPEIRREFPDWNFS